MQCTFEKSESEAKSDKPHTAAIVRLEIPAGVRMHMRMAFVTSQRRAHALA